MSMNVHDGLIAHHISHMQTPELMVQMIQALLGGVLTSRSTPGLSRRGGLDIRLCDLAGVPACATLMITLLRGLNASLSQW
eukprot:CAMPEP_0183339330 /NCGR_PEP_ID=MMETSP0164_2-20130417/6294_1 /TAXON_ID=221442 /ORGANISM="Coccolithus pelagicus ssp braarudi, Strain PLY182g" /LENGTH=80 /DNA_ID=CAMNT_0025509305 /DNA_START=410 /DNA_END=650 /DNA_ORIENTATION=-